MVNRKSVDTIMKMDLSTIQEKKTIPESLIQYTESADNLTDVYENLNSDYVFSESLSEDEFNMIRTEFEGFIESCVDEFAIGSMLPQPGDSAGVDDDDLAKLAEEPWMDKEIKVKDFYEIPAPLVEFVNNPGYRYNEVVNDAIEDIINDPNCPACNNKLSKNLIKPICTHALYKCKLRNADNCCAHNSIIRDIQSGLIDSKKDIKRIAGRSCHDDQIDAMSDSLATYNNLFKNIENKEMFPVGPIDDLDGCEIPIYKDEDCCGKECGNNGGCESSKCECGGKGCSKCENKGIFGEAAYTSHSAGGQLKDEFRVAKRFIEDIGTELKSDLNMIGGKLKKIEKYYMDTETGFVPYKKLYSVKSNTKHDGVKESDLKLSKNDRRAVHQGINKRDSKYGNKTVIVMNGKVPWFKYVLDDKLESSKRHIEFYFSTGSEKWANYYRAAVMKITGLLSPEIKDWIDNTYNTIKAKNNPEEPKESNPQEEVNNDQGQGSKEEE